MTPFAILDDWSRRSGTFRQLFSPLVRSGRSVVRSFVRSFPRILFYFILFHPNYNVRSRWFCTHGEAVEILLFLS